MDFDRFIPIRNEKNWEIKINLQEDFTDRENDSMKTPKSFTLSGEKRKFRNFLFKNEILGSKTCDIYVQNKIFQARTVMSPRLFSYSSKKKHQSVEPKFRNFASYQKLLKCVCRKYNTDAQPCKILDAPNLQDDFYINILDWSIKNILSVALGTSVYLWCPSNATTILNDFHPSLVSSLAWKEDGSWLACGRELGNIHLWDPETKTEVRKLRSHLHQVNSICWDENVLTSGGNSYRILNYDVRSSGDRPVQKYSGHKDAICGLKWSFTKKYLVSGGNDNVIFIWDKRSNSHFQCLQGHSAAVKALAWSPHRNDILASGGGTTDKTIRIWNIQSGRQRNIINTGSQVCNLMWSHYSNDFLSTHGTPNNNICLWNYQQMKQIANLSGHSNRVLYLAVSPNKSTVATAGGEDIRFWNIFHLSHTQKCKKSLVNVFNNVTR